MPEKGPESRGEVLQKEKEKVKRPDLYRVLLHNDDYTTMGFVVEILESIFAKSPAEAYQIMMKVHLEGQGTCGFYPFEVAETKVTLVQQRAIENGFPLRASLEEA